MKMEEWVHHVKDELTSNKKGRNVAYCGEWIYNEFYFVDVGHIVAVRQQRGRLLPCPKCKEKIIEILNNEE